MWHVSSRSGVATLRTAIHLVLTYLLYTNCICPTARLMLAAYSLRTRRYVSATSCGPVSVRLSARLSVTSRCSIETAPTSSIRSVVSILLLTLLLLMITYDILCIAMDLVVCICICICTCLYLCAVFLCCYRFFGE